MLCEIGAVIGLPVRPEPTHKPSPGRAESLVLGTWFDLTFKHALCGICGRRLETPKPDATGVRQGKAEALKLAGLVLLLLLPADLRATSQL